MAASGIAPEISMGEKSFLLPGETFPTNVSALIARCHESVVMLHLPIAFHAPHGFAVDYFRIDSFSHSRTYLAESVFIDSLVRIPQYSQKVRHVEASVFDRCCIGKLID